MSETSGMSRSLAIEADDNTKELVKQPELKCPIIRDNSHTVVEGCPTLHACSLACLTDFLPDSDINISTELTVNPGN